MEYESKIETTYSVCVFFFQNTHIKSVICNLSSYIR